MEHDEVVADLTAVIRRLEADNLTLKANVDRHADKATQFAKMAQELTSLRMQNMTLSSALKAAEKVANGETQAEREALAAKTEECEALKSALGAKDAALRETLETLATVQVQRQVAESALESERAQRKARGGHDDDKEGVRNKARKRPGDDETETAELLEKARRAESEQAVALDALRRRLVSVRDTIGEARAEHTLKLARHTALRGNLTSFQDCLSQTLKIDETFLVDLTCPKCLKILAAPDSLPCGHTFCHACVKALQMNREYVYCCECERAVENDPRPSGALDSIALRYLNMNVFEKKKYVFHQFFFFVSFVFCFFALFPDSTPGRGVCRR